jgi:hypothetical protein
MNRLAAGVLCAATVACSSPASNPSPPSQSSGLPTSFALNGRVKDATTSNPIAAAFVELLDDNGNTLRWVTSDGTGAFRFAELSKGGYTIRISRSGYDSASGLVFFNFGDESEDFRLTPALTTLTGMWAGVLTFSTTTGSSQSVTIPPAYLFQRDVVSLDAGFIPTGPPNTANVFGTIQNQSALGSTSGITGTLSFGYTTPRFPQHCVGMAAFTGTINWTTMVVTAPQIIVDCGITYTNVVLSVSKQSGVFAANPPN